MDTPALLQTLRTHQGRTWRIISGPGAGNLVRIAALAPDQVITLPFSLDNAHSFCGSPSDFAALHTLFSSPK